MMMLRCWLPLPRAGAVGPRRSLKRWAPLTRSTRLILGYPTALLRDEWLADPASFGRPEGSPDSDFANFFASWSSAACRSFTVQGRRFRVSLTIAAGNASLWNLVFA